MAAMGHAVDDQPGETKLPHIAQHPFRGCRPGSMLFGLNFADPMALVVATVLLLTAAALAGLLPARRASRVDPMISLRYE